MIVKRSLTAILALLIALGSLTASAQRPDHGGGRSPVPGEMGTPVAALGCADVETYAADLEDVLDDDGAFIDFVFSDLDFEQVPRDDAEEIITHGEEIVATLEAMDVMPEYEPAHEGIILFFQNMIDFTRFYAFDSSSVPDILGFEKAMAGIYEGETALAEACPDEVDDLGGYIFIDPATLEDEYGPDE